MKDLRDLHDLTVHDAHHIGDEETTHSRREWSHSRGAGGRQLRVKGKPPSPFQPHFRRTQGGAGCSGV